jgi:phosphoglycerate kinase
VLDLPVLEDLPPVAGKRVLLRVDFNVPLEEQPDGSRVVTDDFRIRAALPTISWLVEHGADVVLATHLGRPKGKPDPRYSLDPVRERVAELAPGVELLENLRFDPGEEQNSASFVDSLLDGIDFYVNDAFGATHRAHASIVGPPSRMPSAAGRLLAQEVEVLSGLLHGPSQPFVVVVGGAKPSSKLGLIAALAEKVDEVLIGGGMAHTFQAAAGCTTGRSMVDHDLVDECRRVLMSDTSIRLPVDLRVLSADGRVMTADALAAAQEMEASYRYTRPSKVQRRADGGEVRISGRDVEHGWEALDIGPASAEIYREVILNAATVFWNGPMGVFEDPRFASGTRVVAEAVAACPGFTVVGGGDSASALRALGLTEAVDHVSTGGGASLELIERGDLPGLAALREGSKAFALAHAPG